MEAIVNFDKSLYHPGDTVVATFQCFQPFPKKLRKIELMIHSGEVTKVTYTSSSGKSSSRRTAVEETYYNEVSEIIHIDENTSDINIELTYELPKENIPPISSMSELEVFHRAAIKYDIAHGTDKHTILDIPYQIIPDKSNQRYTKHEEQFVVESSHSVCFMDDEVKVHLAQIETINCRGYRIEFVRHNYREANRHKTNSDKRFELAALQGIEEFPISVKIPDAEFASVIGTNYSIDYYLKIVIDKEMARDINIEVPILYYPMKKEDYSISKRGDINEIYCSVCGNKQETDAVFCMECGVKI